jgi:gluconate 2-dehydrogenase gamma chain
VLAAVAQRILPSDDGPGAAETGVPAYIEQILENDPLGSWEPLFNEGLDRLQELAQGLFGRPFTACSPGDQDFVLRQFQERADCIHMAFFRRLVTLTLEGFLCDPIHGGNRGGLGWSYLDAPEVRTGHCLRARDD